MTNVVPSAVLADLSALGQEDRAATEVLGRTVPPKLAAALIMAEEAEAGRINASHMDALMGAYYGNNLPASLAAQKSKFKQFVDAGVSQLPVVAAIRRAAEMIDTAKQVAFEAPASKDRDKAIKAADKMGAGIFEKAAAIVRLQAKHGKEMLPEAAIRGVLVPEAVPSQNPLGDALAALMAKAEATAKAHGNFQGYSEIVAAIAAAISKHEAAKSAPITPMPQPTIGNSQNNVVSLPTPSPIAAPAVVEVPNDLGVLLQVG